ncbi:hypothetical protein AUEXF2481DRAFT_44274 [Aureobasidium subglaciale EXF-2481]|uniref:Uncharacterized protein n=1 Tax=Aureobasidium subglaciale (strain EXF-2481) TaxID=1043005 RepID=A0A074YWM8_AURSE|nr:uncharacterized protein AUEXF2481DRAFT_44274 [Aureobasidium subglaciale EXF-2481]KAI5198506.1 hypothetical protein E4T38_07448 [Aureobasidium subglaciale]KAI5217317.1 hypothetical protein E4T40_07459 [Aureobasidium subglaciale]KAI5220889.1 hypothetical protein E4T41_07300 [Aureobasidium subglaciale]KAI5258504.1 hypothetical protein E4T46_07277 [Aureobasidium subglaciale]KEQ91276.1 hypothetical protein AUEXF2481DRAFT_44274 [Aureobasidium subglaciale EXF-2481]
MSSFTDLAPEIRTSVYNILLRDSLANNQSILYYGRNPLRGHQLSRTSGRCKRQYTLNTLDRITFVPEVEARRVVHLENIDDLLNLAATCRLLHSDILAMAWSNADIHVGSDTLFKDLTCIFRDRLSTECCAFIHTLRLDIGERQWSLSAVNKTASLITSCLPQLQSLFLMIDCRCDLRGPSGLMALAGLPSQITVIFRYYWDFTRLPGSRPTSKTKDWADYKNDKSFRQLLDRRSKGHRRRKMREEKELMKAAGSALQDTVELRALIQSGLPGRCEASGQLLADDYLLEE